MSLFKKCCIILAVMFAFEVSIAVGMGSLVHEAELGEARIAYSQALIAHMDRIDVTVRQLLAAFIDAAAFKGTVEHEQYEETCVRQYKELRVLLKSEYATRQDKEEIKSAIQGSKHMLGVFREAMGLVTRKGSALDFYVYAQRVKLEWQPALGLMLEKNQMLINRHLGLCAKRLSEQKQRKYNITILLSLSSFINVLLAVLLVVGFSNNVTRRLAIIQDNFGRLRESKPLNKQIGGGDEIERLDDEFHAVARSLKEATEKDTAIFNNLPVGLLACSEDGVIERANPGARSLFQRTEQELIGSSLEDNLIDASISALWQNSNSGSPGITQFRKQGQSFPAETVLARYDDNGCPKVLLAIIDVSERAEMEQFKQQLLSMVSHDLRTPLTSLQLSTETMECFLRAGEVERAISLLERVRTETGRLTRLTSDLLEMARIESKQISCSFSDVSVQELISTAINAVSSSADGKEMALSTGPVDANLLVTTDGDRAVQILVNFLSNAIKYSDVGTDVTLCTTVNDNRVRFSIKDQGRGIPPDHLDSIFEPFKQVRAEDRRKGTGLGLTICKMLAESIRGTVGVESVVNQGSTFWLELPGQTQTEIKEE